MKWFKRLVLSTAFLVLAFVGFVFFAVAKDRGAGDVSAGFQSFDVKVDHRSRNLTASVWYPTADNTIEPELIGQNALFYGEHVKVNGAPNAGGHPVVVYSHGSGGNALQVAWLAEVLTAKGFVVIATNHHGTTSRDSLPERTVKVWERAGDISVILDWIETDPVDGLQIDPTAISVMGFSLGGHTALAAGGARVSKQGFIEYCQRNTDWGDCRWLTAGGVDFGEIDQPRYEQNFHDPRIRAVVAIDPALAAAMTPESISAINVPTLVLNFADDGEVLEGLDAGPLVPMMQNGQYAAIPNSWHFSMMPECSLMGKVVLGIGASENICGDNGTRPRSAVHEDLKNLVLPFLVANGGG